MSGRGDDGDWSERKTRDEATKRCIGGDGEAENEETGWAQLNGRALRASSMLQTVKDSTDCQPDEQKTHQNDKPKIHNDMDEKSPAKPGRATLCAFPKRTLALSTGQASHLSRLAKGSIRSLLTGAKGARAELPFGTRI